MYDPSQLLAEDLLSLPDAARTLPGNVAHSTVYRWATNGVKVKTSDEPIRLESVRLGRNIFTSAQAITRFVNITSEIN